MDNAELRKKHLKLATCVCQ